MAQKGSSGGIFYPIYRYAEANNKYMRDYESSYLYKELSYLYSCDVNNLQG